MPARATPAGSDARARGILIRAWRAEGRPPPTLAAMQAVQAVARHEMFYGLWWNGEGVGSHNWGCIKCRRGPRGECLGDCFHHDDHDKDGKIEHSCFVRYASDLDGARDLLRTMVTLRKPVAEVIDTGDALAIAKAMHATKYFVSSPEAYARGMVGHAQTLAKELGEPLVLRIGGGLARGELVTRAATAAVGAAAGVALTALALAMFEDDAKK